eukprot:243641_1
MEGAINNEENLSMEGIQDEGANNVEEKHNENKEEYITSFDDPLLDNAYGLCIGAAIGDSIGSFCEFRKDAIDSEELDHIMKMKGGGTWGKQVISGQVTDDTELAISLAYGLIDCINKSSEMTRLESKNTNTENDEKKQQKQCNIFDLNTIAIEYHRWRKSHPFDCGFCTDATLSCAPNVSKMKQKAFKYNQQKTKSFANDKGSIFKGNMANGSLMRCMPLCVYGYQLGESNLYKLMQQDSSLTHANYCVYLVNTAYAIMIQYLLTAKPNNDKRHIEAFEKMIKWLETQTKIRKRGKFEMTESDEEKKEEQLKCEGAKEILYGWLEYIDISICQSKNNNILQQLHPATIYQGFIKIAFQRCCYYLLKGKSYSDTIRCVVGEGGDSDTNACIVGGLMGAYHGLSGIPSEYVINIHKCQPKYDGKRDIFQAKW